MEETHTRRCSADVFSFPKVSNRSPGSLSPVDPPSRPPLPAHGLPLSGGSSDRCKHALGRASSASSKDSSYMMTPSRSNSTGSRSSSCNSARTSSSDMSERRLLTKPRVTVKPMAGKETYPQKKPMSPSPRVFDSPHRWKLIAPLPPLKPEVPRRKKQVEGGSSPEEEVTSMVEKESKISRKPGFGRKMLRSFVSTCKECHHIQPSKKRELRLH